jgi:hypothetical protein
VLLEQKLRDAANEQSSEAKLKVLDSKFKGLDSKLNALDSRQLTLLILGVLQLVGVGICVAIMMLR